MPLKIKTQVKCANIEAGVGAVWMTVFGLGKI